MPSLRLTVPLTLRRNRQRSKRKLLSVPVEGACVEVTDGETGAKVGEVYALWGGGVEILDQVTGQVWSLNALDLWNAYSKARARSGAGL